MVIKALSADGILQLKGKSVCENKVKMEELRTKAQTGS